LEENKNKIIEALNKQLITNCLVDTVPIVDGFLTTDITKDILKINLYHSFLFNSKHVLIFHKFIRVFFPKQVHFFSSNLPTLK